jgi:hypothetical protein
VGIHMQALLPMTPCAARSFSISGFSRCVITISTPRRSSIIHSVPNVCADVASSPCTILRGRVKTVTSCDLSPRHMPVRLRSVPFSSAGHRPELWPVGGQKVLRRAGGPEVEQDEAGGGGEGGSGLRGAVGRPERVEAHLGGPALVRVAGLRLKHSILVRHQRLGHRHHLRCEPSRITPPTLRSTRRSEHAFLQGLTPRRLSDSCGPEDDQRGAAMLQRCSRALRACQEGRQTPGKPSRHVIACSVANVSQGCL